MNESTQPVKIESIKEIIAEILYLDDLNVIKNDSQLFSELDLSSIDYIDLCFAMKQNFGKIVEPDNLWPFNKMTNDTEMFINGAWTDKGWKKVCSILNINKDTKPELIRDLYKRFTVSYIHYYLESI
jgi:acyl carrier protein